MIPLPYDLIIEKAFELLAGLLSGLPKVKQQEYTPERIRSIIDGYAARIDAASTERDELKGTPEEPEK